MVTVADFTSDLEQSVVLPDFAGQTEKLPRSP